MVTLAPELDGGVEAVRRFTDAGVIAAIGHTDATLAQVLPAVDAGATVATHLFNGMRPLHHREPGPIGALLDDERVTVELICDLVHLHPTVVRIAARHAGAGRTVLVTDAMAAAGVGDGVYSVGALRVTVRDGVPTLDGGGSLAASTLTLDAAVRNFVQLVRHDDGGGGARRCPDGPPNCSAWHDRIGGIAAGAGGRPGGAGRRPAHAQRDARGNLGGLSDTKSPDWASVGDVSEPARSGAATGRGAACAGGPCSDAATGARHVRLAAGTVLRLALRPAVRPGLLPGRTADRRRSAAAYVEQTPPIGPRPLPVGWIVLLAILLGLAAGAVTGLASVL